MLFAPFFTGLDPIRVPDAVGDVLEPVFLPGCLSPETASWLRAEMP
jgi:hypothetical protein